MAASANKLQHIHHPAIGLVLLFKGWEKIQHHYVLLGALLLLFGLIIITYCVYLLRRRSSAHRGLHLLAHLFEGCAMLFTAYVFFQDGKHYIQYVTLAAAVGFFIAFFVALRRPAPRHP